MRQGRVFGQFQILGQRGYQGSGVDEAAEQGGGTFPRPGRPALLFGKLLFQGFQMLITLQLAGQHPFILGSEQSHPADFPEIHSHRIVQHLQGLSFGFPLGLFILNVGVGGTPPPFTTLGAGATEPGAAAPVTMQWTNINDHWAAAGVSIRCGRTISGTVYEDVNYGGGVGRNLAAANAASGPFTIERDGVTVELYDAGGNYISNTTTAGRGLYSFPGLTPANYTVRVVNDTVDSTRVGSDGTEWPVQTYRIDGDGEPVGTGANKVGGEQPIDSDSPANDTTQTLADLQALANQFTQSIVTVDASAGDVNNVDFGFNFDTIVNSDDANQGSLRQFILNANLLTDNAALAQAGLTAGAETSVFMIPGAADPLLRPADPNYSAAPLSYTIQPATALTTITDPVVLDGSTQPDFPGTPIIQVDGSLLIGGLNVITITAGGSTLRGFVINRGPDDGVEITSSGGNLIEGNYIGTDVTGTIDRGNVDDGLDIRTSSNTIGGTTAAARNIISGNDGDGVVLTTGGATSNVVQGNYIGTDVTGTNPLGNGTHGVRLDNTASNNTIGGTVAGAANIIAFSAGRGVLLTATAGTGNTIQRNSIFNNTSLGIDLQDPTDPASGVTGNDAGDVDTGPNNLQNYPVLSLAASDGVSTTTIIGAFNSTPSTTFTLEFFSSTAADPSGNGEGEIYLGLDTVTTDAGGDVNFITVLPVGVSVGDVVTATATDPGNNTSEFSATVTTCPVATLPFFDDFNRPDSGTVDNCWAEIEGGTADAQIGSNRLVLDTLDDINIHRASFRESTGSIEVCGLLIGVSAKRIPMRRPDVDTRYRAPVAESLCHGNFQRPAAVRCVFAHAHCPL